MNRLKFREMSAEMSAFLAEVGVDLGFVAKVLAGVAAFGGLLLMLRWRLARASRSRRIEVSLLPSSEFDPGSNEIRMMLETLSKVRTASARFLVPRSTRTIRFSLVSVDDGQMAHSMSYPESAHRLMTPRMFHQVDYGEPSLVGRRLEAEPVEPDPEESDVEGTDSRRALSWECLSESEGELV